VCEMAGPNGAPTADEAQLAVSVKYVNDTLVAAGAPKTDPNAKTGPTGVKKDEL
jgi:hypothetical protein